MSRVLAVNVWVDGVLHRIGDTPPTRVAKKIGEHCFADAADSADATEPAEPAEPAETPEQTPETPDAADSAEPANS